MRLWTVHPKFLDSKGLGGAWSEGLLAQNVLLGNTTGYLNHTQLVRFKSNCYDTAINLICNYLIIIKQEADRRGFNYNGSLIISNPKILIKLEETKGQLSYEWELLLTKLKKRDYFLWESLVGVAPEPNPLFKIVPGNVNSWEKVKKVES